MEDLQAYFDTYVPLINKALDKRLPRPELTPAVLHEAMRYSVLGGGKRVRPLLCLLACEACGMAAERAMAAACAVEFVHTYSLIHDDLPAMDDDDLRRGRLTCHKAYGEAIAILAGDALLARAFEVLCEEYPPAQAAACALCLAQASGSIGLVGGQVLDLESEGKELDLAQVEMIDRWKTGALLSAACRMGGIVAGGSEENLHALQKYGRLVGIAFQIIDDLLDIESTSARLGKATGKDMRRKKQTFPAAMGRKEARKRAESLAADAKAAIAPLGERVALLLRMADYIVERKK